MDNRPIGLFDSGIGGLTVLEEFKKLMPNENFIYFADTINLPYGQKTKEQVISYSKNIADFLIKQNVKAIVIACGTASILAGEYLKNNYNSIVPIFDVITTNIKNLDSKNLGVIATSASTNSHIWRDSLSKKDTSVNVYEIECQKLVAFAENQISNNEELDKYLDEKLEILKQHEVDSLVLGCTHFPLFADIIKSKLKNTNLINLGTNCAKDVLNFLKDNNELSQNKNPGKIYFYASSSPENISKNILMHKDALLNVSHSQFEILHL